MSSKEKAKERAAMLKSLRETHHDTVVQTQALLKEQKAIRKQLCEVIRERARSIPEIAAATELPGDQVLWHITALKKYGLVVENGMCGEYYLYQMAEDMQK